MSKSFYVCAAGMALGLTLQGCGGGASSSTAAPTLGPNPQATTTSRPAPQPLERVDNSDLMFVGRWYTEDNRMKTSWGQGIVTKFSGSTRVNLNMKKSVDALGYTLDVTYRIDDGNWTKIESKDGSALLAENLDPSAEHTLRIGKPDESSEGIFDFDYLELDGGYTAEPPARKLVYHAIGDSITAGYKAECGSAMQGATCDALNVPSTENEYNTYVRHLADAWGTDEWSVVARTGVGVGDIHVTAQDGHDVLADHKILDHYKCREWWSGSGCTHPWDFSSEERKPDVITINLGTNDYTYSDDAGPDDDTFKSNYEELVNFVHTTYPDATIFVIAPLQYTIAGPLDGPPNKWTHMHDNVKAVVDTIADEKVIFVETGDRSDPPLDLNRDYVDDTHPTAPGHAKFAKLLEAVMTPVIRQNHPGLVPEVQEAQTIMV